MNSKTLPAISLVINEMRYNNMNLGSVTLETSPGAGGLDIKQLIVNMGTAQLRATGRWQGNNSSLQGTLETSNVSKMLKQMGMDASALIGGNASATFNLSWPKPPYSPSLTGLSGNVALKLGPGRIINLGDSTEAKLGLGRLLNLFSLQWLPRLSFTDMFQNGYSFDFMKGDFKLQNGDAFTNNMRIEGSVASVTVDGRIGLRTKDYNMRLGVIAHVTSSLPMVATIASGFNPIVGVATWAVEKVVSQSASGVTTYNYQVTGPWDRPSWKQVGK